MEEEGGRFEKEERSVGLSAPSVSERRRSEAGMPGPPVTLRASSAAVGREREKGPEKGEARRLSSSLGGGGRAPSPAAAELQARLKKVHATFASLRQGRE